MESEGKAQLMKLGTQWGKGGPSHRASKNTVKTLLNCLRRVLSSEVTRLDLCLMFYGVAEAAVLRLPGLG